MILLEINLSAIIWIFVLLYSPAIIALLIGLFRLRKKPNSAKKFLIFAGVYVIIGLGICFSL